MKFETRLYFVLAVATLQSCSGSNFGGSAGKKTSAEQKPSFTKTETEPGKDETVSTGQGKAEFIPDNAGCTAGVDYGRPAGSSQVGRIVVSHDVNILSTSLASDSEKQFAKNIARWLTGKHSARITLMESNSTDIIRNYSPVVKEALIQDGYDVKVVATNAVTVSDLTNTDAIFVGISHPNGVFPFSSHIEALQKFVQDGGGVYIFAGVANASDSFKDPNVLNPFISKYGFKFNGAFNGYSSTTISSDHPVTKCIKQLGAGNGNSIESVSTVLGSKILDVGPNFLGVLAIFDGALSN